MLCIPITSTTTKQALVDISKAEKLADIIEIRTDYISDLNLERLLNSTKKPVIITNRKFDEGGFLRRDDAERADILKTAIISGVDYIDIEYSSGTNLINELKKIKSKTRIILSYHNFKETPENIDNIYSSMNKLGCDIIKIVTYANSISDNLRIFSFLKNKKSVIAFCMGEYGRISRILAQKYGSILTYASLESGMESAPGQLTARELKEDYFIDSINESTSIFGLVGNPVSESKGYLIHNLAFRKMELNNTYVNFLVDDLSEFLMRFKGMFSGLSVTMPFKVSIMEYLDWIDDDAKKIKAVNTIIVRDNLLLGFNTDVTGAMRAIKEKTLLKNKSILMIGAGGAARAIAYGIIKEGGKLVIADMNKSKAEDIAKEFGCKSVSLDKIGNIICEILINATPVGMFPNLNDIPVDESFLKKGMVVFDIVYNPLETRLIKIAKKNGCKVIHGVDMFVYQAVEQFKLWTGYDAPIEIMREKVLKIF